MENVSLQAFSQLVYDYCGLYYRENLVALDRKMAKRLQALNMTYWDYIRYVRQHPAEWTQIVELLTINETYFYREDKQLTVLKEQIVPQLKQSSIHIWSAACSTGDEPYSIAMMLEQCEQQIDIVATDINERVLQVAQQGIYAKSSLSFRRIPTDWLQQYFTETEHHYVIQPAIRQMVRFEYANLNQLHTQELTAQFDIIFCRNVLIYFDTTTIEKIIGAFHRALKPGGLLFLGHAETISHMQTGFKTVQVDGTFYYQKE